MNDRLSPSIGRRDLLRVLAVGAAAATTSACNPADAEDFPDKRKGHYQADAPEVSNLLSGQPLSREVTEANPC